MPVKSIFGRTGYVFWIGLSVSIAIAALALRSRLPDKDQVVYIAGCLGFAAACVAVPLALDLSRRWILSWTRGLSNFLLCEGHDAATQFSRDLAPYFTQRNMYIVGGIWATAATAIVYRSTLYGEIQDTAARLVGTLAVFAAEFLAGAALTALFGFARAIRRMGNRGECTLRLSRDPFGVLSTGSLMFQCWCLALAAWMLYQIPIVIGFVGPTRVSVFDLVRSPAIYALTFPTLAFMLVFFLWCQLPLHRQMVEIKRVSIANVQAILDALVPRTLEGASEEVMKKVQFFEARLQHAEALPEWPSTLTAATSTLAFSIVSTAVPAYLGPLIKIALEQLLASTT